MHTTVILTAYQLDTLITHVESMLDMCDDSEVEFYQDLLNVLTLKGGNNE